MSGKKIDFILTGGNIDAAVYRNILGGETSIIGRRQFGAPINFRNLFFSNIGECFSSFFSRR